MATNSIPDFGRAEVHGWKHVAERIFKTPQPAPVHLMGAADRFDPSLLEAEPAKKKWTVLLYLDGNNNLYGPAYDTMKSLEKVGSNRDVNLVVQLGANPGAKSNGLMDLAMGGKKMETAKRYLVARDTSDSQKITSPELQDMGKVDMGSPKTVSDFLKWGIKQYPAEHYAVVVFNHGAGFAGVLSDETTHSMLNTHDMKKVVEEAATAAGQKIGVLNFDACLMSQAEVAYAVKDGASYMVASQETERGMAQPLPIVMKDLQEGSRGKAMDPADLARLFVYEAFHQPDAKDLTATMSAIDLQKMDAVAQSAAGLAQAVSNGSTKASRIRRDIRHTDSFCQGLNYKLYNDFRDLGHFATILQNDPKVKDANVKKAAANVRTAVRDAVVAVEHSGRLYKHNTGLSTYLPTNYGFDPKPRTDSVNFARAQDYGTIAYGHDTGWRPMLQAVSKDSAWHNLLKSTLHMSKGSIDSLDSKLALGKAVTTGLVLPVAKGLGFYEALRVLPAGIPHAFLFIGAGAVTKLGMAGGAYQIVRGAKSLYNACADKPADGIAGALPRKTRIIDGALTMASGAALIAVNAAPLLGLSVGMTATAGALALALPVARVAHDIMALRQRVRDKDQEQPDTTRTVAEKLHEVAQLHGHLER